MTNHWIQEAFALFSKEEWESWVKGEINIFDLYVEKVGMSDEDAQRLRDKLSKPCVKKSLTKTKENAIIEPLCEK